jgi:hypothetical protein
MLSLVCFFLSLSARSRNGIFCLRLGGLDHGPYHHHIGHVFHVSQFFPSTIRCRLYSYVCTHCIQGSIYCIFIRCSNSILHTIAPHPSHFYFSGAEFVSQTLTDATARQYGFVCGSGGATDDASTKMMSVFSTFSTRLQVFQAGIGLSLIALVWSPLAWAFLLSLFLTCRFWALLNLSTWLPRLCSNSP